MKLYLSRNGQVLGPYDYVHINQFIDDNRASLDDLACLAGEAEWTSLSELMERLTLEKRLNKDEQIVPKDFDSDMEESAREEETIERQSEYQTPLKSGATESGQSLDDTEKFTGKIEEDPEVMLSDMVEKIKSLIVSDEIDFALDLLRGLGENKDKICLSILQGVEKDYEGGLETPEWMGHDDSRMVSLYVALGMLKGNEVAKRLSKQLTLVNLNYAGLKSLPTEIYDLEFVENLSLEGNQLKDLPPGIGSMKSLNKVGLGGNKFQKIPKCLSEAKSLEYLDLSNNKFKKSKDFWDDLVRLFNLKCLNLSDNSFGTSPEDLSALSSLETFILSSVSLKKDKLSKILHSLSGLPHLSSLDLSGCGISKIPDEMLALVHLKFIELGNNKLKDFPLKLNKLPKLESLSIWGNPFFKGESNQSHEDFPPFDESQTDWPELDFSLWEEPEEAELKGRSRELLDNFQESFEYGGIERINETIEAIVEHNDPSVLIELVRGCSLDENGYFMTGPHFPFPNWIEEVLVSDSVEEDPSENWKGGPWSYGDNRSEASLPFYAMVRLMAYLPQNEKVHPSLLIENVKRLFLILPERMPSEIGCFSELEELVVSCNDLLFLPARIGELRNLKILSLDKNALTELPPAMAELKNLRHLGLNENSISELPQWIGELHELRILDLACNQIKEIPSSIGKLTNLQFLGLRSNRLRALPPEIGKLQSLMQLWLGSNKIEALPEELYQVSSLLALGLVGNPCIPTNNKWLRGVQLSHRPDKINLMAMKSNNRKDAKWILNNTLGWNGS